MTFARIVAESGLTMTELAALYGVSRVTIYRWPTTPPRAGTMLARMAETITATLGVAIDRGILPLSPMDKTLRKERIAKMALKTLNVKPAPLK